MTPTLEPMPEQCSVRKISNQATLRSVLKRCAKAKKRIIMLRSVKRRYITLVELLLVIILMIMMMSLVGVKVTQLFKEQRFNTEVSLVVDQLRLAQDLMLILDTDAHVRLVKDPQSGQIKYGIHVEKKMEPGWQKEIMRPKPELKAIKLIDFEDTLTGVHAKDRIDLIFMSGGSVMSQGVLLLSSADHKLERYICLPGYPRPIVSVSNAREDPGCDPKNEIDFAERLTFYMRREITEMMQVK